MRKRPADECGECLAGIDDHEDWCSEGMAQDVPELDVAALSPSPLQLAIVDAIPEKRAAKRRRPLPKSDARPTLDAAALPDSGAFVEGGVYRFDPAACFHVPPCDQCDPLRVTRCWAMRARRGMRVELLRPYTTHAALGIGWEARLVGPSVWEARAWATPAHVKETDVTLGWTRAHVGLVWSSQLTATVSDSG